MITRQEIEELNNLLQKRKEFYLQEKEDSFLSRKNRKLYYQLKTFLTFNESEIEFNDLMQRYDYDDILKRMMSSFGVHLIRWKCKEQLIRESEGKDLYIFRLMKCQDILIVCNKKYPQMECRLMTLPSLKITNPTAKSLLKIMRTYELVK